MNNDNFASYTNRRGEAISVSEEHIVNAIAIKLELQKMSPSGKCSWARHRSMMIEDGFEDSESSEGYRQMIKREQKKKGKLPSVETYADMVSDNKLDSIKNEIGEMYLAKRDAQNTYRELNKLKRQWSDRILLFDEISESIEYVNFDKQFQSLKPLKKTVNQMVVPMSDWHVGLETEEFNYEVAKSRVSEYARWVVHYAEKFDVTTVHVAGLGDLLNGSYMRANQLAENEFSFSEQIVKATELVFSFIQDLSTELNVVYMGSIIGNHSRMSSGARDNAQEGDSGENVLDHVVKGYIELSNNKRITVDNKKTDNREMSFSINGLDFKAVHGDNLRKNETDKVQKFVSSDEVFYDALLYGHYHHATYAEENNGKFAIGLGSLQGPTEYGKKLGYVTEPSQSVVLVEGSSIIPIRINLDNVY